LDHRRQFQNIPIKKGQEGKSRVKKNGLGKGTKMMCAAGVLGNMAFHKEVKKGRKKREDQKRCRSV